MNNVSLMANDLCNLQSILQESCMYVKRYFSLIVTMTKCFYYYYYYFYYKVLLLLLLLLLSFL